MQDDNFEDQVISELTNYNRKVEKNMKMLNQTK